MDNDLLVENFRLKEMIDMFFRREQVWYTEREHLKNELSALRITCNILREKAQSNL